MKMKTTMLIFNFILLALRIFTLWGIVCKNFLKVLLQFWNGKFISKKINQLNNFQASEVVNPVNGSFLAGMEKCEWLKHIKAVIDTSIFITDAISNKNINVIVHCSDGWDRYAKIYFKAISLKDLNFRI